MLHHNMEEEKTVTLRPVLALHGNAADFSQVSGKLLRKL